jgi:hypothetical protein
VTLVTGKAVRQRTPIEPAVFPLASIGANLKPAPRFRTYRKP